MKTHHLKTDPQHFKELAVKNKTAEIRLDDRGFKAGDFMILEECFEGVQYTGRVFHVMITHVLPSNNFQGLKKGYCLISFSGGRLYNDVRYIKR